MQDKHSPLPESYGAYVGTIARVGGIHGSTKPPTIEGTDAGDGYTVVTVEHHGTYGTMCFPDEWWDRINETRLAVRRRRAKAAS